MQSENVVLLIPVTLDGIVIELKLRQLENVLGPMPAVSVRRFTYVMLLSQSTTHLST